MRKEPIIAVVLGSLIGLGVAFAVWQTTKPKPQVASIPDKFAKTQEENNSQNTSEGFSILEPQDGQVYSSDIITFKGITKPTSYVAFASEDEFVIDIANANGEFETDFELRGGLNTTKAFSFQNSETKTQNFSIVYTTQINQDNAEADEDETAQKLEAAGNKYLSYLGSITDISEEGLQINTYTDQIEQLGISDATTYANLVTDDEITFKDLAIGDFIIAIGTQNEANLLMSERILISTQPDFENIVGIMGEIVTLSNSEFIVLADDVEYSVDATGGVDVTKLNQDGEFVTARLTEADEGEMIIILGIMDEELQAERIHIFPTTE